MDRYKPLRDLPTIRDWHRWITIWGADVIEEIGVLGHDGVKLGAGTFRIRVPPHGDVHLWTQG